MRIDTDSVDSFFMHNETLGNILSLGSGKLLRRLTSRPEVLHYSFPKRFKLTGVKSSFTLFLIVIICRTFPIPLGNEQKTIKSSKKWNDVSLISDPDDSRACVLQTVSKCSIKFVYSLV